MSNLVGNGLLGKRKSSDSEEEFSWTAAPVKQRPKSPDSDKVHRRDSPRGLNGSQTAEVSWTALHHTNMVPTTQQSNSTGILKAFQTTWIIKTNFVVVCVCVCVRQVSPCCS